jgi:hypothetical protein
LRDGFPGSIVNGAEPFKKINSGHRRQEKRCRGDHDRVYTSKDVLDDFLELTPREKTAQIVRYADSVASRIVELLLRDATGLF